MELRRGVLQSEQRLVDPLALDQFAVWPLLDQPTVVQDEDPIGISDGRQTMGDQDRGSSGEDSGERTLDLALGFRIDGRGGLVADRTR